MARAYDDSEGLRALCAAVITLAAHDAMRSYHAKCRKLDERYGRHVCPGSCDARKSAIRFFSPERPGPLAFWCTLLNLDPETVRSKMQAKLRRVGR